jgi:hypothetical protein
MSDNQGDNQEGTQDAQETQEVVGTPVSTIDTETDGAQRDADPTYVEGFPEPDEYVDDASFESKDDDNGEDWA